MIKSLAWTLTVIAPIIGYFALGAIVVGFFVGVTYLFGGEGLAFVFFSSIIGAAIYAFRQVFRD